MTDDILRADRDDAVQALQDILALIDDKTATREVIRDMAQAVFAKIACRRIGVVVSPDNDDQKPNLVAVRIPERGNNLKCWTKRVLGLNPNETSGYAFEGPFLGAGSVAALHANTLVLRYHQQSSSPKTGIARLYKVSPDTTDASLGALVKIGEASGRRWAAEMIAIARQAKLGL